MKQYHTQIIINRSRQDVWNYLTDFENYPQWNPLVGELSGDVREDGKISCYICPLRKTFFPTILSYQPENELVWKDVQGASFLLDGEHYYRLEIIDTNSTKLLHGEYFTGLFSPFIKNSTLKKMESAFVLHNEVLKEKLELL